ncbi:hypothetical protein TWF481_005309 [Arthrobotrys musiformis]|uniref:Uncharacterized protein n=1 Tax=Arthrobotrys musiformis TaxID=47236 RepID=A0AAV9WEV8_9PEZI
MVRNTKGVGRLNNNLEVWNSDDISRYEDNSDPKLAGSYYPAAIDVASESPTSRVMDISVDVVDQMLGVPFILFGGNNEAEDVVRSDASKPLMFFEPGPQKIRVTVSPPWVRSDTPWAIVGDIEWRLRVAPTGQVLGINSTRLEFYAITEDLPEFYQNSVDVTLLRRFVAQFIDRSVPWVDHCCSQTFGNFSFVYDSYWGGASFAGSRTGGSFNLNSYLASIGTKTLVNCYDQASITQIALGLSPTTNESGYVYMDKFGWIVTTNLIGRGQCNNPFFLNPECNKSILCPNDAEDRSYFDNHAFNSLKPRIKDQIVDACAGPITGGPNLQGYIDLAIQTETDTTLYHLKKMGPGTAKNADFNTSGVTDLDGTTATSSRELEIEPLKPGEPKAIPFLPGAPSFLAKAEHLLARATAPSPIAETRSNANLGEFFGSANLSELGWTAVTSSVVSSANGTSAEWTLSRGENDSDKILVTVKLFIATGGLRDTTIAFGNHLSSYTNPHLGDLFQAPTGQGIRGQLNLESIGASDRLDPDREPGSILIWVYSNVFVQIAQRQSDSPSGSGALIHELADKLHAHISSDAKPIEGEGDNEIVEPKIRRLSGPQDPVAVGELFTVHVSLEGKSHASVATKSGNVVLSEYNEAEGSFSFYAVKPGEEVISFSFAHEKTLNSTTRGLEVKVVKAEA